MSQTFRPSHVMSLINADGKAHPKEDSLAAITAILGVIAIVSSFFPGLHLLASWSGLIGIITGGYGQFISVTTGERFVLIISLGASAVGFYLGMAHGGLWGGV